MKSESPNNDLSRRKFLLNSLKIGATISAGSSVMMGMGCEKESSSEEKVKLLSPDGKLVEVSKSEINPVNIPYLPASNAEARKGMEGKKFVMVIDLSKCKNAGKCRSACNSMHFLPEERSWIKIYKMQNSESTSPYWQPTMCQHCDQPPCVKVCPVDATFKRQDGIVLVDNERCIGCRFCMAACPYSTRVFNWGSPEVSDDLSERDYSPETSRPSRKGTVEKCDFCPDMIRMGKLPDCITACPNGVIYFGDMNEDTVTNGEETVRFSELIRDKSGYRLMEELGTKPSVYYLPPVNRLFPFEESDEPQS